MEGEGEEKPLSERTTEDESRERRDTRFLDINWIR
jgi:hypothetical protein